MSIEILVTLAAGVLCLFFSVHVIPERHLGVYFKGGALMNTTVNEICALSNMKFMMYIKYIKINELAVGYHNKCFVFFSVKIYKSL